MKLNFISRFFSRKKESAVAEDFRREFTATVAHELKTPLTAILGATEMLGDGSNLSEAERKELLAIVHEQAARLSTFVKDVLALTQLERDELVPRADFAPVPLNEVVETVVALARARAKKKGVDIRIVRNDWATVQGDAHLLEQALDNLIENALRYSGSPVIEVSLVTESAASGIILSVVDRGVGIPSDAIAHIFERFYRVDKARSRSLGGTGLGLAIVKHIVLLHGGDVSVASEPGERTAFTIRLPRVTVAVRN